MQFQVLLFPAKHMFLQKRWQVVSFCDAQSQQEQSKSYRLQCKKEHLLLSLVQLSVTSQPKSQQTKLGYYIIFMQIEVFSFAANANKLDSTEFPELLYTMG